MITRTRLSHCPHCGRPLDAHGDTPGERDDKAPRPGDVSVCMKCGGVMIFTEGLGLRIATPEEMRVIDRDPKIQSVRFFIQHILPGIRARWN
jgi:hypothetical protein